MQTVAKSEAANARSIFGIALPLMAGFLLEQLIGLTDVIFLGRYGEAELAGAGVANIYVLLVMMLGLGYSVGAQSLMSRRNGARNRAEVGAVFRQTCIFLGVAGLVLMVVTWLSVGPLFDRMIEDPSVRDAAESYVFWRTAGLPIAYLTLLGRAFFVAILQPRIITVTSVVMVVVNCGLNWFLIFGVGPFPELGIAGAAIASALSEVAALAVLWMGLRRRECWYEACMGEKGDWRPDMPRQMAIFRLGRWLMLQEGMAFGVWLYFFIVIENVGGERALAYSNIIRQLGSLGFLFVHAFGSAAGTIAANAAGAGRGDTIPKTVRLALGLCAATMAPFFIVYALCPNLVLGLLTDIPEVIEAAHDSYYVMVASYFLTMPAYLYYFVIGALGYAKQSFRITTVAVILYASYIWTLNLFEPAVWIYWTSDAVYGLSLGIGAWLIWRAARARSFVMSAEERELH